MSRTFYGILLALVLSVAAGLVLAVPAGAQNMPIPSVSLNFGDGSSEPGKGGRGDATPAAAHGSLAGPGDPHDGASFTRIVVVLSILRHALGTQQLPANQIVIGLALFLTFFIMTPVWQKVNSDAIQPYMNEQISTQQAFDNATVPIRDFMLRQTREKDMELFIKLSGGKKAEKRFWCFPCFKGAPLGISFGEAEIRQTTQPFKNTCHHRTELRRGRGLNS